MECQSPDRGRKRTWSSDRGKGAPRAPLTSPTPPPRPFRSPSQEPRCWAKQPVLGFSRGKVGGGDRWGRVKSREASLPRQSGALFSMPHTSDPFPTLAWLGGGVGRDEWGGGRTGDYLPLAMRKPLHCEGRAVHPHPHPRHLARNLRRSGEKPPTPSPLASVRLEIALRSGGRTFEDVQGLVQVYGLAREE